MRYRIPIYLIPLLFVLILARASCLAGTKETLTLGLPPFANPSVLQHNFMPLAQYLSSAIGQPVTLTFSPNYISHVMRLGRGEIDIGYVGPSPYVKVKDKFGGVELLARLQFENDSNNQIVFVTGKQSSIKAISDLAGKTFAFGDYQSFGSHFLPRYLLHENGLPVKDLTAYDYVGSHDNVVLSVLHGDFDAGGVRFDIFKKYEDRPLRIIYGPEKFSPHVLVCRTTLPDNLKKEIA